MQIQNIRTPGLGDSTYVVTHDGVAIVVDPQRDFDRFETVLDQTGADLRFVLETHLHNDYISGGRDLVRSTHPGIRPSTPPIWSWSTTSRWPCSPVAAFSSGPPADRTSWVSTAPTASPGFSTARSNAWQNCRVACETGVRAALTASALQARGFEPILLAGEGVTEIRKELSNNGWGQRCDMPVTTC